MVTIAAIPAVPLVRPSHSPQAKLYAGCAPIAGRSPPDLAVSRPPFLQCGIADSVLEAPYRLARNTELENLGPVTIYVRTEIAQPRNPALLCFTDRGHPAKPYDPIKGGQNDDTR